MLTFFLSSLHAEPSQVTMGGGLGKYLETRIYYPSSILDCLLTVVTPLLSPVPTVMVLQNILCYGILFFVCFF